MHMMRQVSYIDPVLKFNITSKMDVPSLCYRWMDGMDESPVGVQYRAP